MRTLLAITIVTLTAWGWPFAGWAADQASQQEMKSLDEQVQVPRLQVKLGEKRLLSMHQRLHPDPREDFFVSSSIFLVEHRRHPFLDG